MTNPTSLTRRRALLGLALALSCPLRALASDTPDQAAVRHQLMRQFDQPQARLQVDAIVVQGQHALANWAQGERGGRALLRRQGSGWAIVVCGGDGLKDRKALQDAGLPTVDAQALIHQLKQAERSLSAAQLARYASFEGMVRMNAQGEHPPHKH